MPNKSNRVSSPQYMMSRSVFEWWLYTRKEAKKMVGTGGFTMPGLFQTYDFRTDMAVFFFIIALEGFGLYNLYAITKIKPVIFLLAFLVDLLLAILYHLPEKRICRLENERFIIKDTDEDKLEIDKSKKQSIDRLKYIQYFFIVLIMGIALGKAFVFYSIYRVFNGLSTAILLSYLVAGALHIRSTGYFIFEICTSFFEYFDYQKFLALRGSDQSKKTPTDDNRPDKTSNIFYVDVDLIEVTENRHKLKRLHSESELREKKQTEKQIEDVKNGKKFAFEFLTMGVFDDENLQYIINRQTTIQQQSIVATYGVEHQLSF